MDDLGLLENFASCTIHENWKIHFQFSCDHALCNSHHLRDMIYLAEQDQQDLAGKLIKLLLESKEIVETTPEYCLA